MNKLSIVLFSIILATFSCSDAKVITEDTLTPVLPETPYAYNSLNLPVGTSINNNSFPEFEMINGEFVIKENIKMEVTPWGATLGRVLFYDKKLSLNSTVSCGSCHHQEKAFADGLKVSTGFEGRVTERNSMGITNPILQNNLFWDSRSKTLHDLSLQPVQNHIEMGMENLDRLVEKLENTDYYRPLFKKAFGSEEITPKNISSAMSQFVASITSNRAKFDQGQSKNFSNFTDLEKLGKDIFHSDRGQCSSCHGGNNFSALDGPFDAYGGGGSFGTSNNDLRGATNIGLDLVYKDNGLGNGKFKIPGLRNVALTGPYMHDGRFNTLEEVINHYSNGVKPHKHLDVKFTDGKGNVKHINFTTIEKKALVAFLNTLTDTEMTTNPKWSNPFKK
jgi:cytochrome c peroxidase